MKKWGALVLFLALSGCQGPDQFIQAKCEEHGSQEGCTCFRDSIKKSLDHKTYLGVADSALGNNQKWAAHVRSLTEAKKEEVMLSFTTAALSCQVMPWDELAEPFVQGPS